MKTVAIVVLITVLAVLASGCGGGGEPAIDVKALVEAKCLNCHGIAEEGPGGGPALANAMEGSLPNGMGANDSTIRDWLNKHDDKIGEKLSSGQIGALLEHLKSIQE